MILTDVAGVYANWPDTTEVISQLSVTELRDMIPSLAAGMIPKLTACLDAVTRGVPQAHILDGRVAHSLHASFVAALRPGPVELGVERLRDGRTFATRQVVSSQGIRPATLATVSFHGTDTGVDYQISAPADLPAPVSVPRDEGAPASCAAR